MKLIKCIILIGLFTNNCISQVIFPDCLFSYSKSDPLELDLSILQIENKIESNIIVSNYNQNCIGWKGLYINGRFFIKIKNYDSIEIDQNRIKRLRIFIDGTKKYSLDKSQLLTSLPLSSIREIYIHERNSIEFNINLSRWQNRKQINDDSLSIFVLDGYSVSDSTLSSELKYFKNIKQLKLPFYINSELCHLKHLQSVDLRNSFYFFANNLVCINSLKNYYEPRTNGFNFFNTDIMHAQKDFFLNHMVINNIEHPIYTIDSLLKIKYSEKLNNSGKFHLLFKEAYNNWKGDDTLASGDIINGKKRGIWKYNLEPYNPPYLYNYDDNHGCSSVSFPLNGEWLYRYTDGTVAIRGFFKDGQKDSTWTFYKPDGQIESYKTYKNDAPFGLYIDYEKDIQIRKYYFNQFHYIIEISEKGKKTYYTITSGNEGLQEGYNTGLNGDLYLMTYEKALKRIKKDSQEYKKILQQHFLKYLYANK